MMKFQALRICRGDIERSADWAFNNWDSPCDEESEAAAILDHTQRVQNEISGCGRKFKKLF